VTSAKHGSRVQEDKCIYIKLSVLYVTLREHLLKPTSNGCRTVKIRPATPEAYELFHEGVIALSEIEANGIRVDVNNLNTMIEETNAEVKRLERELREDDVFDLYRRKFDRPSLGSHQQLGKIVFGSKKEGGLGFQRKKGTARSPGEKNNQIAFDHIKHDFVKKWFELQKKKKVTGTFLKGIKTHLEGEFLHPNFGLHVNITYRGQSDDPNFQNLPVRIPENAKIVRSNFIARDNHVITENDFGGIEVCGAACYNHDPVMIQYIKDGYDYHKEFAAKCYKLKVDEVTKDTRYCGKNKFVFPEFYGSYYIDCALNLWEAISAMELKTVSGKSLKDHLASKGITKLGACDPEKKDPKPGTFEEHIKKIETDLWKLFHVYKQWKADWIAAYRKRGWFQLHTGFVCSGLYKNNDVTNYPVQGSAFHCLLWVLIQMQKWLKKYKMRSKIVGQIHDSIIGDVHVREYDDYMGYLKYLVEVALPKHWDWIIVPMKIEAEVAPEGKSWYYKKSVPI
jgi:DNA polymerase I